jgi:hypothetical protein
VTFKPEITLGQVVQVVVFLVGLVAAVRKFGKMEQKLDTMYDWFVHTVLRREEHVHRVSR